MLDKLTVTKIFSTFPPSLNNAVFLYTNFLYRFWLDVKFILNLAHTNTHGILLKRDWDLSSEQWALVSSCVTVTYICIMYILNFDKSTKYTWKANVYVQNGNSFQCFYPCSTNLFPFIIQIYKINPISGSVFFFFKDYALIGEIILHHEEKDLLNSPQLFHYVLKFVTMKDFSFSSDFVRLIPVIWVSSMVVRIILFSRPLASGLTQVLNLLWKSPSS